MSTTTEIRSRATAGRGRAIGVIGTAVRLIVGLAMLGSVIQGQLLAGFVPSSLVLGLVGFPAVLLAWQWARARRNPSRFQATGPVGHGINLAIFLALYLTPWYAPALSFTSDAAVIFYGTSMVLAAIRGYAGCEVLALSNLTLRRDDQVGCVLFWPVDHLEKKALSHGHQDSVD